MTTEIFTLESAGIKAYDVYRRNGRFAGLIVLDQRGAWRHYYNDTCTKGSARKFQTIDAALDSVRDRLARLAAKRAA